MISLNGLLIKRSQLSLSILFHNSLFKITIKWLRQCREKLPRHQTVPKAFSNFVFFHILAATGSWETSKPRTAKEIGKESLLDFHEHDIDFPFKASSKVYWNRQLADNVMEKTFCTVALLLYKKSLSNVIKMKIPSIYSHFMIQARSIITLEYHVACQQNFLAKQLSFKVRLRTFRLTMEMETTMFVNKKNKSTRDTDQNGREKIFQILG